MPTIPGYRPAPTRPAAMQQDVRRATSAATQAHAELSGACYMTAASSAARLGGDLRHCPDATSARGRSLAHLAVLERGGKLLPGMAIYMNLNPGTDPSSTNMANQPHWVTYVGKDGDGTMRFADQYNDRWSLADLCGVYAPRRIDLVADPIAGRRPRTASRMGLDDRGTSWGRTAPADRDRNFGHAAVDRHDGRGASLYAADRATGELVWADNGRRVMPGQWALMDAEQKRNACLAVGVAAPASQQLFDRRMANAHRADRRVYWEA